MAEVLRRYTAVVRKRLWVIVAFLAVGVTASVLITLQRPKIYEATATVVVDPEAPKVNKDDQVVEIGAGTYTYMRDYYNTQLEVMTSFPLARATVVAGEGGRFYDHLAPREDYPDLSDDKRIDAAAENLLDALKADQHKDSRVIAIRVRDKDADIAQALANQHVASYIAYVKAKRATGTGQASELLAAQLDDASKALKTSEDKMNVFKSAHGLFTQSFDDKQNTLVAELQRYSAALADARVKTTELAALKVRAEALANEDVLTSPIFGLGTPSGVVDELKAEYARAQQKYAEVDATFGPKSEEHIAAQQKVEQLHVALAGEVKRIIREIDERYAAAVGAESGFSGLVEASRAKAADLDKVYADYAPLVRDQKNAEDQYKEVSERLSASQRELQNSIINVEPHEQARDAEQVLPRMELNVALAAIVSLLLGLGVAFLLEQMDRTLKGADGVEQLVGSPVLGIIPIVDTMTGDTPEAAAARDLFVFNHPTSQAAECCRSIRTNIMFSAAERPMKTITVSSARPREGKTTTTIYLGTIMAQSGQRVLMIDTDLRRPRLHSSLGVAKERGLTSLLVGEATYDDVIKSTEVPNLFVLPCGPRPPNPAELLLTNRFRVVLSELSARFDRVLLDSPPLLAVTDAAVLAKLSDGVVLVGQSENTSVDDLAAAGRQIRDVEAPILGVIVNTVDISNRRYGYKYQYYYGYGGYGDSKAEAG
jgi:capsular exopolysaccharide synthesis family protein